MRPVVIVGSERAAVIGLPPLTARGGLRLTGLADAALT